MKKKCFSKLYILKFMTLKYPNKTNDRPADVGKHPSIPRISEFRVLILQGSSTVPTICGYNTGQHMYIDASDDCNIINLDIDTGSNQDRSWSFRVKQSHKSDETISSFWLDSTLRNKKNAKYFRNSTYFCKRKEYILSKSQNFNFVGYPVWVLQQEYSCAWLPPVADRHVRRFCLIQLWHVIVHCVAHWHTSPVSLTRHPSQFDTSSVWQGISLKCRAVVNHSLMHHQIDTSSSIVGHVIQHSLTRHPNSQFDTSSVSHVISLTRHRA